jgi:hypothetical protein
VSLIPGGGWRATWKLDDGTTESEPLIGWGVTAEGSVIPLTVDLSSGFVDDPTDCTNFAGLQAPAANAGPPRATQSAEQTPPRGTGTTSGATDE